MTIVPQWKHLGGHSTELSNFSQLTTMISRAQHNDCTEGNPSNMTVSYNDCTAWPEALDLPQIMWTPPLVLAQGAVEGRGKSSTATKAYNTKTSQIFLMTLKSIPNHPYDTK